MSDHFLNALEGRMEQIALQILQLAVHITSNTSNVSPKGMANLWGALPGGQWQGQLEGPWRRTVPRHNGHGEWHGKWHGNGMEIGICMFILNEI